MHISFQKHHVSLIMLVSLLLSALIGTATALGKQSLTIDYQLIPMDEFNLEKAIIEFDHNPYKTFNSGETRLIEPNRVVVSRLLVPTIDENNFMVIVYAQSDSVPIFYLDDGQLKEIRPEKNRYLSFRVTKEIAGKHVYAISFPIYVAASGPVEVLIQDLNEFQTSYIRDYSSIGLIIGIIGIMTIYNIGMLILFKKMYLFFYILYCCSFLSMFVYTSGLIKSDGLISLFFYRIPQITLGISMFLFSINVLSIPRKTLKSYLGYMILSVPVVFWILNAIGFTSFEKFILPSAPAVFLYCFVLAAISAYQGFKPAYAMMLGWSAIFIAILLIALQWNIKGFPNMGWVLPIGMAFEIATFSFAMGQKLRLSELKVMRENQHAFSEMSKMVYPHQLNLIRSGTSLEATMPTNTAQACVISFDIVGSSKIKHMKIKDFFRNVFARCNEVMNEGYDGKNLKARAYRIKEMGDGFLCSVGYPFASVTDNPAADAVELAELFARVLAEESKMLHTPEPITCGIGIAIDNLTGFYPEAGTKEYDLFGPGLILATRYEGMRKVLFESEKQRSILIIQEMVYLTLDPPHREGFELLNLKEMGIVVRDDPSATKLYYRFLDQNAILPA